MSTICSSYRVPDLHAPRFRPLLGGSLNAGSLKAIRSQVPGASQLSDAQIKALLKDANQQLGVLLLSAEGVELPAQLGQLFLAACAPSQQRPRTLNHRASNLAGQPVLQLNHATDGHLVKVIYSTQSTRYAHKNHELCGFRACKDLRRAVGHHFPEHWQQYVRLVADRKTRDLYFQQLSDYKHQNRTVEVLKTYDELAF